MKCPHCTQNIHSNPSAITVGEDRDGGYRIAKEKCPSCHRVIITMMRGELINGSFFDPRENKFLYPMASLRPPPPEAVTSPYRDDYIEACMVISMSPKASAALTRRCLQSILKEKGGFKQKDLADQIEAALTTGHLPSHISDSLDAVRNIGNFAAHTQKSKASGEILDIEPGEAEWNLETIEALFDFYFVQPDTLKRKRDSLNEKLKAAGKPPLK